MKASKAIRRIQEILSLEYNAYGEDIHPTEQLDMIQRIILRVKEKKE